MDEADAVARPLVTRAALESELRQIEERQSRLDRRRALYEAMKPTPHAFLRQYLDNLDVLAAARDRLAAGWDRLAAERDVGAESRDAQARERERAQSERPDAGLDRTTRGARTPAAQGS